MTNQLEQKQRQQFVRKSPVSQNVVTYICLFLLLCSLPCVAADGDVIQSPPPPPLNGIYRHNFDSSSMGMLLAILIAVFLFMGFFLIYLRQCSEPMIDNPNGGMQGEASRRGSPGGLDPAVIEAFPTFPYSYVKDHQLGKGTLECAVCLTEFEDDDKIRLLPKCDHAFHPDCIDAWFCNRTTCPVCRTNFAPVQGETPATIVPIQDIETGDSNREIPPTFEPRLEANEQDSIHRTDEEPLVVPEVINRISMQNRSGRSISGSMKLRFAGRFPRSHSTGHSVVRPQDVERFTLRLPEDLRKQIMSMSHPHRTTTVPLNRTRSLMMVFPMLRKGFWSAGEASSRGRRSMTTSEGSSKGRRSTRGDMGEKSEGWIFSMTPPFFMRAASSSSGSAKMTKEADTPMTLRAGPSGLPLGVSSKSDRTEFSSTPPPS